MATHGESDSINSRLGTHAIGKDVTKSVLATPEGESLKHKLLMPSRGTDPVQPAQRPVQVEVLDTMLSSKAALSSCRSGLSPRSNIDKLLESHLVNESLRFHDCRSPVSTARCLRRWYDNGRDAAGATRQLKRERTFQRRATHYSL